MTGPQEVTSRPLDLDEIRSRAAGSQTAAHYGVPDLLAVVDGVLELLEALDTMSEGEHANAGCEGEPDCAACVAADLRRVLGRFAPAQEEEEL